MAKRKRLEVPTEPVSVDLETKSAFTSPRARMPIAEVASEAAGRPLPFLERIDFGEEREAKGWVLVTVDGFPLGWGKRVQGRLKSHLPSWLRRM